MTQDCPNGWKNVAKIGILTKEDATVDISGGICDSADRCGIKDCEYYDLSEEGTHFYVRALHYEGSLEGTKKVELIRQQEKAESDSTD